MFLKGSDKMNLSEKIQDLRKQNNLSQEQFAEKLNVSRQAVSKWESGQSIPDVDKIIAMSEIFEVSTDYLLKDVKTKEKSVLNSLFSFEYNPKSIKMAWILGNVSYLLLTFFRLFTLGFVFDLHFYLSLIFPILFNIYMIIIYKFRKYLWSNKDRLFALVFVFIILIYNICRILTSFNG